MSWTVIGAGNLVWDIFDAIEAAGDRVERLALNTGIDARLLENMPAHLEIVKLEDFKGGTDACCFGFIDPAKEKLLYQLKALGLEFRNIVHPFSYVSSRARLGRGNFIGAGAVLAPNARIGDFNFVNRCASLGHDSTVGDFCHLGPGATVAGRCAAGDRIFLGAGSVVIDGLRIADDVLLGAGATAVKDLEGAGAYIGTPARKMDPRADRGKDGNRGIDGPRYDGPARGQGEVT